MSGQPIQAVKKGAIKVADKYNKQGGFDYLECITYASSARYLPYKSHGKFVMRINDISAGGGTNFIAAFDRIQ